MSNYDITMDNARNYILENPHIKQGYQNLHSSSCSGYVYTLDNEMTVKLKIDKTIDFFVLEVFPRVTANRSCVNMLSEYCQMVSTDIAYLTVDQDRGVIGAHCETNFRDNPVSEELIQTMEILAIRTLQHHLPVLEALACGKLPNTNCWTDQTKEIIDIFPSDDTQTKANIAAIRRILLNSKHNIAAENLDPNDPTRFFIECMTETDRFLDHIQIRPDGWLVYKVKLNVDCSGKLISQISRTCNNASFDKKVGFLRIEDGYPTCSVSTFLLDGSHLISEDTLNEFGYIAKAFLSVHAVDLQFIANGLIPPDANYDILEPRSHDYDMIPKVPSLVDILEASSNLPPDDI